MKWDVIPEIDRKPAIPIYRLIPKIKKFPLIPKTYRPGRILCDHNESQCMIDNHPQELLDSLGPGDCLWVPLYRGSSYCNKKFGGNNARNVDEKLPQFKRNIEFAVAASKIVYRIIVGNAGIETWMFDPDLRSKNGEVVSQFIRESCAEMRSYGIEPMYSYAELHRDCYTDKWIVRDTLIELDLIELYAMPYEGLTVDWGIKEDIPYYGLRKYLEGGRFWAGVNYIDGMRARNDEFFSYLGFEAGVMGWRYPTSVSSSI